MPNNLNENIRQKEFDQAADVIVNSYSDWVATQNFETLDFQSAPQEWFEDNLTLVLNSLIRLNSKYTEDEIQLVFKTHAAQLSALANVCHLVGKTEF